jgi:ketosteroid isomerase-like protein
MNKKFLLPILMISSINILNAQKNIDGLLTAERNFAAYSVINGTRDAFLKFLDSSGIVFNEGKAVNGIKVWSKRENRPGVLNWHPHYAGISLSGDLGFTTGPWTFQQTITDTVIARGIYTTVWHVDENGEWKFLIDLGVANTPLDVDSSLMIIETSAGDQKSYLNYLVKAENVFIALSKNPGEAYKKYVSSMAVLSSNNSLPKEAKESLRQSIQYTILGSGIASSGDLGYVYGTTVINGKTDNYLRIWRMENGDWRIVVEVLRY